MKAKRSWKWLWILTVAGLLSQATIHLVRPATTYKLIILDADAVTIGFVTGFYALFPLIFALYIGSKAQEVRSLRGLLAGGALIVTAGVSILAFSDFVTGLVIGSAILGLGQLMFMLAAQAVIARFTVPRQMDVAFGWFTVGLSGGQLLGPLLGGLLLGNRTGPESVNSVTIDEALWIGSGLSLLSVGCVFFARSSFKGFGPKGLPSPSQTNPTGIEKSINSVDDVAKPSLRQIVRVPTMKSHMVASIAMISILDILSAFLPLLGEEAGISPLWIGILLSIRASASIVSRVLLGVLRRNWSREALVLMALGISGVALAVMPFALEEVWVVAALLFAAGFFLGLGQPLTMSLVAQSVPSHWRSPALAVRLMGNRAGQVLVPVAAGALAAPLGSAGAIWCGCCLLLASGIEKGWSLRRI